jgi:hypothetical protein
MARTLKGKVRKETKDEKRARLARNRAAHEQCQDVLLPCVVAAVVVLALALYFFLPSTETTVQA